MHGLQDRIAVLMTFGGCNHAAKSILKELETTEFSVGPTKICAGYSPLLLHNYCAVVDVRHRRHEIIL